jgi:hypothetical protein
MAVELGRGRRRSKHSSFGARGVKAGGLEEAVNSRCRLKRQIHGCFVTIRNGGYYQQEFLGIVNRNSRL